MVRRRISDILTINDHDREVVKSFKYLQTIINNTKEETEETKAIILTANNAHYSAKYISIYTNSQQ